MPPVDVASELVSECVRERERESRAEITNKRTCFAAVVSKLYRVFALFSDAVDASIFAWHAFTLLALCARDAIFSLGSAC